MMTRHGRMAVLTLAAGLMVAGSKAVPGEIIVQSGFDRHDIRLPEDVVPGESRHWVATDFNGNEWRAEGVLLRDRHGRSGPRAVHIDGGGQSLTTSFPESPGIGEVSFWYHPLSAAPSEYTIELQVLDAGGWESVWRLDHEDTAIEWRNAIVEVDTPTASGLRWVMTAHGARGIMLDDIAASSHGAAVEPLLAQEKPPTLREAADDYTLRTERAREGWGVVLNTDGDLTATDPDPQVSVQNLRDLLGTLAGTPVRTVMYSVGAGSDILYYPSEYGSYWGWRPLPGYDDAPRWGPRIEAGRAVAEAGIDMIGVVADSLGEMGIQFVPSIRMNDAHYVFTPHGYPLTGRFWMENQDKTVVESPIEGRDYGHTLSFLHQEVRDYRFGIISEVIERYGDRMEGIELDFNRFQVFFPEGRSSEGMPLMTGLMRDVRARLDERSAETGREYAVFARVPPSLRNCHWSGLDVETWALEGLVDVVIPAQLMTIAHDKPVGEFVELLSPHGVAVMPSLYGRTQWNAPMTIDIPSAVPGEDFGRGVTPAQIAGVIINGLHQGADGFQMFNMGFPRRPDQLRITDIINDPSLIEERSYMVTAAYYLDHEDNYQYRKQIPLDLPAGETRTVTMMIGEDLSSEALLSTTRRTLRVGFADPPVPDTRLRLAINGTDVYAGPIGDVLVPIVGPSRGATSYAYFSLDEAPVFRIGENDLAFTLTPSAAGVTGEELVEIQLLVAPIDDGATFMETRGRQ